MESAVRVGRRAWAVLVLGVVGCLSSLTMAACGGDDVVGRFSALALDQGERVLVVYPDESNSVLKYIE